MNAKERHQNRRFRQFVKLGRAAGVDRERADRAEITAAHLRGRVAELEAELAATRTGARTEAALSQIAAETIDRNRADHAAKLDELLARGGELLAERDALAARVVELDREVASLREQELDTGKLRRRLRERVLELDAARARIAVLERAARPLVVDGTVAVQIGRVG